MSPSLQEPESWADATTVGASLAANRPLLEPSLANRPLLEPSLATEAKHAAALTEVAYLQAQDSVWNVFSESMLTYDIPAGTQLDLLEVYAYADSRLADAVRAAGGLAQGFTKLDGDLATPEGQPKHIWVAPECRLWGSWSQFNASRSTAAFQKLQTDRQADRIHMRLCARIHAWQLSKGRHFHLEQPEQSRMLQEPMLREVSAKTQKVVVDMCAFGLRTPVSKQPIRKRTALLTTLPELANQLCEHRCPGTHTHQQVSGRIRIPGGVTVATSQFAGSYCQGFAKEVARIILNDTQRALAADTDPPRTRKRFKTSGGRVEPVHAIRARKRGLANASGPVATQRRVMASNETPASQSLTTDVWKPVFDLARTCSTRSTPLLIPTSHELFRMLKARIHDMDVLQVFVGIRSRTLHNPMGALPSTVAPLRMSLACMSDEALLCLGKEARTTMAPEHKKRPIKGIQVLITILGRPPQAPSSSSHNVSGAPNLSTASGEQPGDRQPEPPELSTADTSVSPGAAGAPELVSGWAPPPTPLSGPAFRNLTAQAKQELVRIHRNLGHPAPLTLSAHLKAAGADPKMVEAAKDYQCDSCLESTQPRHQRPSKLQDPKEFNQVVGIDGFFFKGKSGFKAYVVHVLDEASCFHLGRRAESRHGAIASKLLNDFWCSWAGYPEAVYIDPAGEFRAEELLDHFQGHNVRLFTTAAAWQRGRIERHGDVLKQMLERMDVERVISGPEEFDQALLSCFQAKNSLARHKGYSPEQIVLGRSLRVPGSICSDEDASSHAAAEGEDLEAERHRQRLDIRCRARQAFLQADNSQAIRRACLRRSILLEGHRMRAIGSSTGFLRPHQTA